MKKLLFLLGLLPLFANSPLFAAEPDQIYQKGLQAYTSEDYLAASEHLFAYRHMAGTGLSADFLNQVNKALAYAEAQVQLAIQTKRELDEHGKVTEVTVEASGKADAPGTSHKKTEPFHHPSDVKGPKPGLPSKLTTMQGGKFIIGKAVTPTPEILVRSEDVMPEKKSEMVMLEKKLESLKRKNDLLREQLKRCQVEKKP